MLVVVTAVLLLVHSGSAAGWCPETCSCDRFITGEREITCQSGTGQLMVNISPDIVRFECSKYASPDVYAKLESLDFGTASRLFFILCPLPPVPFLNISRSIGTKSVTTINFQSFQNLTEPLSDNLFRGLTNLSHLRLYSNGFTTIPSTLFKGLPQLKNLEFRDNFLKQLPSDLFSAALQLESIDLGNNRIESLDPDLFEDMTGLKYLYLWSNYIKVIDELLFENLTALEILDLQSNQLETLSADVFRYCISLKVVNLSRNKFSTLPEGLLTHTDSLERFKLIGNSKNLTLPSKLFAELSNLKVVDMVNSNIVNIPEDVFLGSPSLINVTLSGNKLSSLPVSLFKDQTGLSLLDLSYNSLDSLPDGLFRGLLNLKTILLHHNSITNISSALFRGLRELTELNLEHNRLVSIDHSAFSELFKLQTAHFSNNNLTLAGQSTDGFQFADLGGRSPFHSCVNLEYLYLTNNSISEIFYDWKVVLYRLRVLNLTFNAIEILTTDDVHFLSQSVVVDLRHNKISKIDLSELPTLAALQGPGRRKPAQFILDGASINCDCVSLELAKFASGALENEVYDLVNLVLDDVHCMSPPALMGRKFTEVTPGELLCKFNKLCPEGCDCFFRRFDMGVIVNCTARGLMEVPATLPIIASQLHTELLLEDNHITKLPSEQPNGYSKVTQLFLAGNRLSAVDTTMLNSNLTMLTLDNNNFTHLSKDVVKTLGNLTHLKLLTLHGNPWICDCSARDMLAWMQVQFKQIGHLGSVNCSDGRPFSKLSAGELCPAPLALVLGCALVAACGVVCGTLAALYYRFNHSLRVWLYARGWCLWLVTEEELDKDKKFDAFVSFSQKDEDFVVNKLVPGLESCGLKLCLHYRDWVAGDWIPTQIARSVEDSRRTLVVLSPNFLDSVWGRLEFRAAHKQALSEGRARVVMLMYGEVPPADQLDPELRAYISVNTYVKWGDPWFWDKLRYALPHRALKPRNGSEDHLGLIRLADSPVNSPSTPPGLSSFIPSTIFPKDIYGTHKEPVISV